MSPDGTLRPSALRNSVTVAASLPMEGSECAESMCSTTTSVIATSATLPCQ